MNRIAISARHDWQAKVEDVGLSFHTPAGQKYWDESAYYQLRAGEVDTLDVDLENQAVGNYVKLYPWEWMWHEPFARYLKVATCNFIEPMWKMLLCNNYENAPRPPPGGKHAHFPGRHARAGADRGDITQKHWPRAIEFGGFFVAVHRLVGVIVES
jgi:hypothetical protein